MKNITFVIKNKKGGAMKTKTILNPVEKFKLANQPFMTTSEIALLTSRSHGHASSIKKKVLEKYYLKTGKEPTPIRKAVATKYVLKELNITLNDLAIAAKKYMEVFNK